MSRSKIDRPPVGPIEPPAIPPPQLLPGQFAIQTFLKETFLTAVAGGGRIADAIHTDATQVGAWEKFNLWAYSGRDTTPENPEGFTQYAVQTQSGNYITAMEGGGRTDDVLHTDATQALAWEKFGLIPQSPSFSLYPPNYQLTHDSPWYYAIPTKTGNYLTALGGGGDTDPSVHSDATKIASWELFRLIKCGELMSGYQYAIRPIEGFTLTANNGGGLTRNGLFLSTLDDIDRRPWTKLTLLEQDDGSYAMQTVSGNYVTAVGGGGIPPFDENGTESDVFHTDAVRIQAWEKFRILDQGDGTYVIQTTVSREFIGAIDDTGELYLRTDIQTIEGAARFRLSPLLSEN
ncbi:MAG: hypothetical protein WAL56_01340 [Candidatus Sulfotelmatobacter sp.]